MKRSVILVRVSDLRFKAKLTLRTLLSQATSLKESNNNEVLSPSFRDGSHALWQFSHLVWVLSPRPWVKHKRKGRNSGDFHLPCEELFHILTSNRMKVATEVEVSLSNHRTSGFGIQVPVQLVFQGPACNLFAKLFKTLPTWPWEVLGICSCCGPDCTLTS